MAREAIYRIIVFLNCFFDGPEALFCIYSPLPPPPLEDSLHGNTIRDGSPSKDCKSNLGREIAWFEPGTEDLQSDIATNEPPLLLAISSC